MKLTVLLLFFPLCSLATKSKVLQLNEDTWQDILEGEWMVEFYAPWCPACKGLQPIWEDFAGWSDDLGISIAQVDITTNPGLSGRFMVTALPTIYHVKDGIFRQYRGARDKDELISFVEERKWEQIDAVPSWKSPTSPQMSAMALFFKLSMGLRYIHNTLVEEYGIPNWGSYLLFGVVTVLIGGLLGLLLVFIVDLVSPTKPQTSIETQEKEDDLVEEAEGSEAEGTETEDEVEVSQDSQASQTESEQEDESQPTDSALRKRKTRKAD